MSLDDYDSYFQAAGQQYGVDPQLLRAVATVESGGDPKAESGVGAQGVMQLMPSIQKAYGVTDPFDPKQSINGGARLLAENLSRYKDTGQALMAYNAGLDRSKWNPKYSQKVMDNYQGIDTGDPVYQAYLAAKNGSAPASPAPEATIDKGDPVYQAYLDANKAATESPTKQPEAQAKPPAPGVMEDMARTIPSAVAEGVGAVPQLPAMAGNAVADAMGQVYGWATDQPAEMRAKLAHLDPFFTGNTLADAMGQSLHGIVTGSAGPQNPVSGDVMYTPQTTGGKYANALVQAGIAGPATGAGMTASLLGGAGGETANMIAPNNPLAALIGGSAGFLAGKGMAGAVTPEALPSDVATVIKAAKDDLNINTPANVMSGGNNLLERLAGKADTKQMTGEVNRSVADMIGANDNGEGHTTLNKDAYLSAEKNNSAAYNQLFAAVGDVPLQSRFGAINSLLTNLSPSGAKEVGNALIDAMNPDGTIPASEIKNLTKQNSVLQRYAGNRTDTASSRTAEQIMDTLNDALSDKASPDQMQTLQNLDVRYKTMKAMEPVARKVGAGGSADVNLIRDTLNKSFDEIYPGETPPTQLSNYLNTVSAPRGTNNLLSAAGGSGKSGNFVPSLEAGMALMTGNIPGLAVPIFTKYAPMATSRLASRIINTEAYKNALLRNAY